MGGAEQSNAEQRGDKKLRSGEGKQSACNSSIPPQSLRRLHCDSCFLIKVKGLKEEKRSHNKQLPKLYFSIFFPTQLLLLAYWFNFLIRMLVKKQEIFHKRLAYRMSNSIKGSCVVAYTQKMFLMCERGEGVCFAMRRVSRFQSRSHPSLYYRCLK